MKFIKPFKLSHSINFSSPQLLKVVISFKVSKHTKEKRGASLLPGPRYKGLRIALSVEPSNAESPTNDAYSKPIL